MAVAADTALIGLTVEDNTVGVDSTGADLTPTSDLQDPMATRTSDVTRPQRWTRATA